MYIQTWLDSTDRRWTVAIAETPRERRRGLLGLDGVPPWTGLLLTGCRSVHTVGMAFPIDAVALNGSLVVLRVVTLQPGRLLLPRPGVRHVLELAAGSGMAVGTRLRPMQQLSSRGEGRTPVR
jgi:uncharacterized membrane protein (UPF0127 family)